MSPLEGPVSDPVYGYHTLWIAEVPFIPTFKSETYRDFDLASANRLDFFLKRQKRFLSDLAVQQEYQTTFELRFVSWPQPHGPSQVGIAFVGKVFQEEKQASWQAAQATWEKFIALFPREVPFSYPLVPILEHGNSTSQQTHDFVEWYQPVPFEQITQPQCLVELRKYEDWPTLRSMGNVLYKYDYLPHPFEPALDYSALARLFETLACQREICMVSITLRPQRLTDSEIFLLHDLLGWHQRVMLEGLQVENPLKEVLQEFNSNAFDTYFKTRAARGVKIYQALLNQIHTLFSVRLQILGLPRVQESLVEGLGSEIVANINNEHPSLWSRVQPATPQELQWARFNAQWLEFARWGLSSLARQVPSTTRLRQIATADEVAGAFRLPIAPANDLAGIEVRDEPFTLPSGIRQSEASLVLGTLQDRGVDTLLPCLVPLAPFAGITCLFGEASQDRYALLHNLLRELQSAGVPWVVISDTSSGESFASESSLQRIVIDVAHMPAIQPFLPPLHVSLPAFIDAMMHIFTSIYSFDAVATFALRKALFETYKKLANQRNMGLEDIIGYLDTALQQTCASDEAMNAIQAHLVLPLQEILLMTDGMVSSQPLAETIWTPSTLIKVDLAGSGTGRAIMRGCLWAWSALALSARSGQTATIGAVRGIVVLETAHTIFGNTPGEARPASFLAQTLAQAGIGTLFVDSRPDLLDEHLTGSARVILATRNGHGKAQEQVGELIGANQREKARLRRLNRGEAIVTLPGVSSLLTRLTS
jgi:hypothetical protein